MLQNFRYSQIIQNGLLKQLLTGQFCFGSFWQKQYSLFPKRSNIVFLLATRIMSYTSDLPHTTVNQLVAKAFKIWSEAIPLTFKRVRWGTADIMIGFARRGKEDSFRLILCAVLLVVYIRALLFSRFKIFNEIQIDDRQIHQSLYRLMGYRYKDIHICQCYYIFFLVH